MIDIYQTTPETYQAQIARLQDALRLSHAATAGAMDTVAALRAEHSILMIDAATLARWLANGCDDDIRLAAAFFDKHPEIKP